MNKKVYYTAKEQHRRDGYDMYCKYCGAQIDDDSIFCNKCGKSLVKWDEGIEINSSLKEEEKETPKQEKKHWGKYLIAALAIIVLVEVIAVLVFVLREESKKNEAGTGNNNDSEVTADFEAETTDTGAETTDAEITDDETDTADTETEATYVFYTGDEPSIYYLNGHGSEMLSSTLQTELADCDLFVSSLDLTDVESVPDDCLILLIYNPSSDLTEEEAKAVKNFLSDGGSMLVVTDIDYYSAEDFPQLSELLAYYGLETTDGVVVETNSGYYYQFNTYLLPELNTEHEIMYGLASYYILFIYSQGIRISDNLREGLKVVSLIDTTDASYAKVITESTVTYEREGGEEDGPFSLAVVAEDSTESSKIVYFSGDYFLDDSVNSIVSGANHEMFLNSVVWLLENNSSE